MYQVGDKVKIKNVDHSTINKYTIEMLSYCGRTAEIVKINLVGYYSLDVDGLKHRWTDEMLEMLEKPKDPMLEALSECFRELEQKDMETNKTGGFVQTESSDYRNEVPGGFFGQQGWICPKCGRVYSPFTAMCPYCKGGFEQKVTAQGLNFE